MYNARILAPLLLAGLGFRQADPANTDEPQLPPALLAPEGAVALQDVHPLLTLRNIRQTAPEMSAAKFLEHLQAALTASATKVLQAFSDRKKLTAAARTVLSETQLTGASGEYRHKIIKAGRFVGLALRPDTGSPDVGVSITAVGTQLTEPNPDFRLYLYHSSDTVDPVQVIELPRRDKVFWEWTAQRIELPTGYSGGEFYLGYFEDDLLGQAIRLDQDFTRRPCQSCGQHYLLYDKWAPLLAVRAFSAAQLPEGQGAWADVVSYYTDSNFGLNLRIQVACELTDFLGRHAGAFASAVQLQAAVDFLNGMAFTTRQNGTAYQVPAQALLELKNTATGTPGLLARLDAALQALDVDLSGLAAPCLPCEQKPGAVRFKAA
ncbi:hypothetical protein LJ737_04270 [Hymenobacter sp. 15J16-1T3B]|uniref:hypothetical protein n=1 Tax=Hymenobacter sp. 15J16-1T3B TaxID=2886941 RepID=UPI001D0F9EF7|nr:hypothetical protein [Hymenobacter sp. 15J16-1T3B]MCC3156438.1 hypothetical protein [Hymenobacter sp. 15J16-1T3B]